MGPPVLCLLGQDSLSVNVQCRFLPVGVDQNGGKAWAAVIDVDKGHLVIQVVKALEASTIRIA